MPVLNPQFAVLPSSLEHPGARTISPDSDLFLRSYIRQESGIQLGEDKQYLLQTRLAPILRSFKIASFDELCRHLRLNQDAALKRRIIEAMTTHETLFFRDAAVFEVLASNIFPEIARKKRAERKMRIWSAACSSGQEPYSLAILLDELGLGEWDVRIVATDLSSAILERAATGRYLSIEIGRGLSAARRAVYFDKIGQDWQVKSNVQHKVEFQQADLRQAMIPLEPFDMALCRNVLIYFDKEGRKRVLDNIWRSLVPGGFLVLGSSETTFSMDSKFTRRQVGNAVFYQK